MSRSLQPAVSAWIGAVRWLRALDPWTTRDGMVRSANPVVPRRLPD